MNDIGLRSSWDPSLLKGASSFGLRAPRAHSARGPRWIAPKGKLARTISVCDPVGTPHFLKALRPSDYAPPARTARGAPAGSHQKEN